MPTMANRVEEVEAGLLMSYGPNRAEQFRQAAAYADKILRGTKPADLPVEQPTKFEMVINLKTAKALGITNADPAGASGQGYRVTDEFCARRRAETHR